jgi:hypothetical protein
MSGIYNLTFPGSGSTAPRYIYLLSVLDSISVTLGLFLNQITRDHSIAVARGSAATMFMIRSHDYGWIVATIGIQADNFRSEFNVVGPIWYGTPYPPLRSPLPEESTLAKIPTPAIRIISLLVSTPYAPHLPPEGF